MTFFVVGRRELLRLGVLGGLSAIVGCGKKPYTPLLASTPQTLPKSIVTALPFGWRFQELEIHSENQPFSKLLEQEIDTLALSDGWLQTVSPDQFKKFEVDGLEQLLSRETKLFLSSFGMNWEKKVFPLGVSPWVMLFRNGEQWLPRARSGWEVLLDPELKDKVILPQSPRLVISLANHMKIEDSLRRLRSQVRKYDDQNAINWLLHGEERVTVLPLQRCLSIIKRDQRFKVAIPKWGAPLHWTLLVCPLGTSIKFPNEWIEELWRLPSISRLLSGGFFPPLEYSLISTALKAVPKTLHLILPSSYEFWKGSWSLPFLSPIEKQSLKKLWEQSTP